MASQKPENLHIRHYMLLEFRKARICDIYPEAQQTSVNVKGDLLGSDRVILICLSCLNYEEQCLSVIMFYRQMWKQNPCQTIE